VGGRIRSMDEKTLQMLLAHSWPGNIRELQNVTERWAILSDSQEISIEESWFPGDEPRIDVAGDEQASDGTIDLRAHIEAVERALIGRAMKAVGGNRSEAARRLGLSRGALLERLRKYKARIPWGVTSASGGG
jgi:DNA-binding NtrC family response regulator